MQKPSQTTLPSEVASPIRLRCQDLGLKRNGQWLFQNLELNLRGGTLVAVVGPSGVGKSSLLACICGSERPTTGNIEFLVKEGETRTQETIRPNLGLIFQSLRLTAHATVLDNVLFGRLGSYNLRQTLFGFKAIWIDLIDKSDVLARESGSLEFFSEGCVQACSRRIVPARRVFGIFMI